MDDLISRQAAIDNLERYRELFSWDDGDRERAILSRVIKELQSMPSAEKKGGWIRETGQYYQVLRCDQCGHVTVEQVRNYCPNCGAKIEENE